MKENVKLMRNVLKVLAIAILFVFVVAAKSYAADPNSNFDNLDFVNIPENSNTTTTTEDEEAKKKAEEEAKKKAEEEAAKKKAEEEAAKKKTTSTSSSSSSSGSTKSASNTKMPATGSNTEIIFAVGAVILVSGAIFIFKKQNIKLK